MSTTPLKHIQSDCTDAELSAVVAPKSTGLADFEMMNEWASSLAARLPTIDLRHASLAVEWFSGYAKSHIKRAEELRAADKSHGFTVQDAAGNGRAK